MENNQKHFAALLVDFENLYYFIKNRPGYDGHDTMAVIVRMIQQLRSHLESEYKEATISLDAYADFERIEEEAQKDLYLLGFDTHNVLGTDHKNAADMQLCIDAMEILYTRPEISTFVVIAGDRDYIPVVKHLKRKAKTVRVVGFHGSTSGDLVTTLGQQYFIDGQQFLAPKLTQVVKATSVVPTAPESLPAPIRPQSPVPVVPGIAVLPSPAKTPDEYDRIAIGLVFEYKGKPEVWMSPYLHKLRAKIPELSEPERKAIINRLEQSGAIKVQTRSGDMHDFTVFTVNWNHPLVRETAP
jgi:uncharacterized LabA/DUF88 family protein